MEIYAYTLQSNITIDVKKKKGGGTARSFLPTWPHMRFHYVTPLHLMCVKKGEGGEHRAGCSLLNRSATRAKTRENRCKKQQIEIVERTYAIRLSV
jgi:hypothetical protein